jgi:hypothetical protein
MYILDRFLDSYYKDMPGVRSFGSRALVMCMLVGVLVVSWCGICHGQQVDADRKELIMAKAHKDMLIKRLKLPKIQEMPNPLEPFVFLHVEKTAGTTLRE